MMNYARKLALLLFTVWMVMVMAMVFITLQRTQKSLQDLRGQLILQRLLQLPQRLLATSRAPLARPPSGTTGMPQTALDPGTPPQRSVVGVESINHATRLQRISVQEQGNDWSYRLETVGAMGPYRHFSLAAPARWVIDLPGRWQPPATTTQHFSSGPVQNLLLGHHPQHLRVVFWVQPGVAAPLIKQEEGAFIVKFSTAPGNAAGRLKANHGK